MSRQSRKRPGAIRIRRVWKVKPVSHVKPSGKVYRRQNSKRNLRKEKEEVG